MSQPTPPIQRFAHRLLPIAALVMTSSLALSTHAQTLPPAGQIGKDAQGSVPARSSTPALVAPSAPTSTNIAPISSAGSLPVKGYSFEGNTVFGNAQLQAAMELPPGNVSFAQLESAVDKISRYYRSKGYLVARAYLPPQTSNDGVIKIAVIEGQYAAAKVSNTTPVSDDRIKATINQALCGTPAGCADNAAGIITDDKVERALRLVGDIPGVSAGGELQPGSKVGTSNLAVTAKPNNMPTQSVGVDNYGSRYTGISRFNYGADFNNLDDQGSQLSLGIATTGRQQLSGSVSLNRLVGYDGLRVGVGLGRSQYLLGDAFALLNAHGSGTSIGAFATYPLIRHRERNLMLRGSLDAKWLSDQISAAQYSKQAYLYGLGLTGDLVDTAGGYNNFLLGLNGGDLQLKNDATRSLYANSKSEGNYHKLSFFLSRQQAISGPVTAYVAVSGQTSYKNLDGSEKMALGGPFGVRAYPGGEGAGDRGIVGNFEVRYTQAVLGNATLTYAGFVDRGWSQANINTWVGYGGPANRAIGGYGVGIVLNQPGGFAARLMLAKHSDKDPSTAEPNSASRAWLQLSKAF